MYFYLKVVSGWKSPTKRCLIRIIPAFRLKRIKWSPFKNVTRSLKCKAPTTILIYAVKQCYTYIVPPEWSKKKDLILYLNYDIVSVFYENTKVNMIIHKDQLNEFIGFLDLRWSYYAWKIVAKWSLMTSNINEGKMMHCDWDRKSVV